MEGDEPDGPDTATQVQPDTDLMGRFIFAAVAAANAGLLLAVLAQTSQSSASAILLETALLGFSIWNTFAFFSARRDRVLFATRASRLGSLRHMLSIQPQTLHYTPLPPVPRQPPLLQRVYSLLPAVLRPALPAADEDDADSVGVPVSRDALVLSCWDPAPLHRAFFIFFSPLQVLLELSFSNPLHFLLAPLCALMLFGIFYYTDRHAAETAAICSENLSVYESWANSVIFRAKANAETQTVHSRQELFTSGVQTRYVNFHSQFHAREAYYYY
eukprot:TRINITY_DN9486_c0_g1_i1.p1 TRINITY_DN9486_c0_g1~~TRINITY_DN9486_c0_g1_i1.p1  ORF type:complete len:273 (+),score=38.67 TRINITY_DN9486_c0_g1_i1:10-828(+)